MKWIQKGGSVGYNPDGSVIYTSPSGVSVQYSGTGYPDFSAAGLMRQQVQIDMKGNYTTDFRAADSAAPLGPRLQDNTWHHNEDTVNMQEINSGVHQQFPHSGGVSVINANINSGQ